jgi:hypothetical protein
MKCQVNAEFAYDQLDSILKELRRISTLLADSTPKAEVQPASAEKPQAVADAEGCAAYRYLSQRELDRRVAEARTAAREEAIKEVRTRLTTRAARGVLREDYVPGTIYDAVAEIDKMLARPSGEVPK